MTKKNGTKKKKDDAPDPEHGGVEGGGAATATATAEKPTEEVEKDKLTLEQRHQRFRDAVTDAEVDHAWWLAVFEDSRFKKLLATIGDEIEATKEELVSAEKTSDMVRLRADVRARRALVQRFTRDTLTREYDDRKAELRRFEEKHPLLLKKPAAEPKPEPVGAGAT